MPVDIEGLAAGYAHRPTSAAGLARADRAGQSAGLGPGKVAVDIGGGRGDHARRWLRQGAHAIVADPAAGMAREAARDPDLWVVRAEGQALPLCDGAVSLAYFHLSIHYGDWVQALDEVERVLEPGGECWIWTMGERHHRGSFLARWFPSVGDIDTERFPDPARIVDRLSARFRVESGKEVEPKAAAAGQWRRAVEAGFVSTLQLVPPAELRDGLARFAAAYPDGEEVVEYVLTFDWIRAKKS